MRGSSWHSGRVPRDAFPARPGWDDAVVLEAIDAVSWGDLPGPDLYEPDRVATSLRALADHLRSHAGLLAASEPEGRWLLADAAHHWRFDVQEAVAEGDGVAAFGALAGRFPGRTQPPELHRAGHATPLAVQVSLVHPLAEGSPDACLLVDGMDGMGVDEVAPSAVLLPARCGSWGG
ncbi:hypothetical protein ACFVAG_13590 [Streptomyces sp. NPDC057644]|uniref:hypothetical protein n=1 Tax=Streptomyces sp. NPDC057644 TaxID=3346191 RepID=UPI0036AAF5DC